MKTKPWQWLVGLGATIVLLGCRGAEQVPGMPEGQRFLLAREPAGAKTISEAKQAIGEQVQVVVVGRIAAGDVEPFEPRRATFILTEILDDGHAHATGHDADNCPFCKRKAAQAPKAVVQFLDDQGQVLPHDARKLLGLRKGQVVVVQGRGEIQAGLNLFVVTAERLYVKRS